MNRCDMLDIVKKDIVNHLHRREAYPTPRELFDELWEYRVITLLWGVSELIDDGVVAHRNYRIELE